MSLTLQHKNLNFCPIHLHTLLTCHTLRFTVVLCFAFLPIVSITASPDAPATPKKKAPTVAEVMASIAPDVMPKKAHNEKDVHIMTISVEAKRTVAAPIVVNHDDPHREGIDVSHYQGRIDWHRVARDGGVTYAYIKATEGADLVDNMHTVNLAAARKAGLKVGSYHFYRPKAGVEAQFRNMTSIVIKSGQDLVPIIDIEDDRGVPEERFIADLSEFLHRVTKHYGKKPLLYTGQNFYNKHFQGLFHDYQWMIAKYQEEAPILLDGSTYAFWQYTAKGRVPGINGNVDRSCMISINNLKSLSF